MLLVFDRRVFKLAWRDREQMERLGDRHGSNLGADLLGEANALLDGLGGEIRPVGRDQDVLVQYNSPGLCFFLTRRSAKSMSPRYASVAHDALSSIFLAFAVSAFGRTRRNTPSLSVASIRSRSMFSESVKTRS